jgi:MFS transporter, DHA2 family, multidrug resistance protein
MSAVQASEISGGERRVITIVLLMATFMQGANVSIPNAALTHMQGALSMADDEVGWLFTSYLVASVLAIPLTPWLANRFGRKLVFQISMVVFSLGLVFDTLATSPIPIVIARAIQGAAGGTVLPLAAGILLDVLPPERRARINLSLAAWVLFGISAGPCIGGWLSEYHGWPSIFYCSLPLAGFVFLAVTLLLPEKKAEHPPSFDFFGFATFALGVTGLQMVLDRGERLEWFDSTEIWVEALASALGFYMFVVHVLTTKSHFFDKGLFKDRNFVLSTIMYFGVGFVLLPTLALTSPMLEELLNYPVDTTGYMTIPRGLTLVAALVLTGFAPARIDSRMFVIVGLAIAVYADWRMLGYSPAMDWRAVSVALLLQGVGVGMLIPALTRTAFSTLDQRLLPEGRAIFNLTRLYGGTIGIAVVQDFFYANTQAMHLALAKGLTPYRAAAHLTGRLAKPGLAKLNDMITGQAAVVSIIGQFKILLLAILVVSPLVLFLRGSRPAVKVPELAK